MSQTVGDFIVERLHEWGVRRIFGYPGDGINGVFGALNRARNKIAFVQARHEEMAAFMASAYAKFSGELGVCIATSGPGASHLITGLYDARLDHMPVLAIVGQQSRDAIGGHYQQEVDLVSLFKDVAGAFVQQASSPAQVRHLIDRAIRIALGDRRVTAIVLPNDLQEEPYRSRARKHGTLHSGVGFAKPRVTPFDADLRRAAEVLNAGEKVAILVGAGALGATDEVIAVAETLGAGVAKALLGKAALPDDLPYVTGSIGLLGSKPSYALMTECDTLLMVGSGFPYSEFLPKRARRAASRSTLSQTCCRCAIRWRSISSETRRKRCASCSPFSIGRGSEVARRDREASRRLVEALGGAGDATRETRQSAARRLGAVAALARQRDRDQRLRDRARTGTRGT